MTTPLRLADLLPRGETALAASGILLAQKLVLLDASGVELITNAQLDALLGAIPTDWSFVELGEIIDAASLNPTVAEQLAGWVARRTGAPIGRPPAPPSATIGTETELIVRSATGVMHPLRMLDQVIEEYRDYLRSEFRARDTGLKEALERELDTPGFLAQETFYQAHRPFKRGTRWQDLPLEPRLAQAMARRAGTHAYLHQSDAINHLLGPSAGPMVVTTGTGSGKTETFLLPVIQNAITDATHYPHPGLTAILVYPMNALANDQFERISVYLSETGLGGMVTVRQYDRGTSQAERQELRRRPPHILLTNYMMLEYLLVRPADREGIFANHRCRFLVLDEVHSYRGTLGSNIALLVRRLRAHLVQARQDWRPTVPPAEEPRRFPALIPIGTSATIKTLDEGTQSLEERIRLRDSAVQTFFSTLTGAQHDSIRVISETLEDLQPPAEAIYPTQPGNVDTSRLDVTDHKAVHTALCALTGQPSTLPLDSVARRARLLWDLNRLLVGAPRSLSQLVAQIQATVLERTSSPAEDLIAEIEAALVIGAALPEGTPGALRLRAHRFIRGGWQFHRCLNPACGKLYPMGEGECQLCGMRTAPLYLCRSCGADYLRFAGTDPKDPTANPLTPSAAPNEVAEWLLYEQGRFKLIQEDENEDGDEGEIPGSRRGTHKVDKQMRGRKVFHGSFDPASCWFSTDAHTHPLQVTLAPARTQCLCCGATLGSRNVLTPVALGTSAAVKVIAEGLVGALAEAHRSQPSNDGKERLLVFSDSRQDAAHQARFIIFASRYDRMRRRVFQTLREHGPLSIQQMVERLRDRAVNERDNPATEALRTTFIPPETQQRIQAWEEAPLLDEIALNAGYRATLINLGLVQVVYYSLEDRVRAAGTDLLAATGLNTVQFVHLCRCLLDAIRSRGCLGRELLRYHPLHPGCPDALRAADWERRVKRPQGYPLDKHGQPLTHFPTLEHVLLAIDSMRHIQHGDQFSRPGQTKTAALSFGAAHQPGA